MRHQLCVVALIAGCGNSETNPIDELVIPRLALLGIEPQAAPAEEYCRRLAVDLWGRIPSPDELAACVALPDAGARVDAAMSAPIYERTMRRAWGEHLGYDNYAGWTEAIVELDALVGELYAGDVRYGDFATRTVVHDGFLGLHRYDVWAAAIWRVFLGRVARADEIASFRPLSYVWQPRYFCEGHVYYAMYRGALEEGLSPAEAKLSAEDTCLDLERLEMATNFCVCASDDVPGGCTSEALGKPITFRGACAGGGDTYDNANLRRIADRNPDDTICADGMERPQCRDVQTDFGGETALPPLQLIDGSGTKQLAQIGDALVARGDFWEAAVDREAKLLLGWWQTTFRQPDSDLPDVRRALAERLRDRGSVRDLQRVILTSVLYTSSAAAPFEDAPDFAMGPTKLMSAETWLDSAALAVGEPSGVCDFRWVTAEGYYDHSIVDSRVAEQKQRSIYDARTDQSYIDIAIQLGGCSSEQKRPTLSNVGMTFTEGGLTELLCAYGRGVVPEGWSGDLAEAARHVIVSTLARTPDDAEVGELVAEMTACIDGGAATGCANSETAARWLCQRALESVAFTTY
jgi:hypothetical protein